MGVLAFMLVGFGEAIGAVTRLVVLDVIDRWWRTAFPWGVLVMNVIGTFFVGMLAGLARVFAGIYASPMTGDFIIACILVGYATVSSICVRRYHVLADRTGDLLT